MFRRLVDKIYGADPAQFSAPGSPQHAAHLLARATPRTSLQSLFGDTVVGAVSVERVSLRYHRPVVHNSFAPFFHGCFSVESGQTVLRGTFGLHPFVKAFMTLWFGLAAFSVVASLVLGPSAAVEKGAGSGTGFLAGLSFAAGALVLGALGVLFVRFAKWLSRGDAERIRQHILLAFRSAA